MVRSSLAKRAVLAELGAAAVCKARFRNFPFNFHNDAVMKQTKN